jgi:SAM-dependent methyltransferase
MNPIEELYFRVSIWMLARSHPKDLEQHARTENKPKYAEWRASALRQHFDDYFQPGDVEGKRVVDFGCGGGQLCIHTAKIGAASIIGLDLYDRFEAIFRDSVAAEGLTDRVTFVRGEVDKAPLAAGSAEVVTCFGVMEHVMNYEAIVPEWRRILVPGGRVLIWWGLWYHPYGHHCYAMVRVPWAHVVLSDAALLRICARVYDSPVFRPSFWDLDEQGQKNNRYRHETTLEDTQNKLTTWRFDQVCRRSGFEIARKEFVPFTGQRLAWLKRVLVRLPYLADFFSACVVYELKAV